MAKIKADGLDAEDLGQLGLRAGHRRERVLTSPVGAGRLPCRGERPAL